MLCPQSAASEPGRKPAMMRTWIQKQLRLRARKLRWKLTGQSYPRSLLDEGQRLLCDVTFLEIAARSVFELDRDMAVAVQFHSL